MAHPWRSLLQDINTININIVLPLFSNSDNTNSKFQDLVVNLSTSNFLTNVSTIPHFNLKNSFKTNVKHFDQNMHKHRCLWLMPLHSRLKSNLARVTRNLKLYLWYKTYTQPSPEVWSLSTYFNGPARHLLLRVLHTSSI